MTLIKVWATAAQLLNIRRATIESACGVRVRVFVSKRPNGSLTAVNAHAATNLVYSLLNPGGDIVPPAVFPPDQESSPSALRFLTGRQ